MYKIFISLLFLAVISTANAENPYTNAGFGTQYAWENPGQNIGAGQFKPGYSKINWEPGKVMPIKLRDGMITIINFPAWEKIIDAYIGDKDFFDGRPVTKNTFLISPVDGRSVADTNMVLFGKSGNKYVFYMKSEPLNTETTTHSEVDIIVPVAYKKGTSVGGSPNRPTMGGGGGGGSMSSIMPQKKASGSFGGSAWEGEDFGWIKTIPVDPTEFRFDLDIYVPNPDDYVIAPERVWRDQIFTYIDFGEKALYMNQRPAVSLLIEGGEAPVGFRTEGPLSRLIVVEAVGDIVLRSGGRIVCIKRRSKPYLAALPTMNTKLVVPQIEYQPQQQPNMMQQNMMQQPANGPGPQTNTSFNMQNGQIKNGYYSSNTQRNYLLIPADEKIEIKNSFYSNTKSENFFMMNNNAGWSVINPPPARQNVKTNGSFLPSHYVPLVRQKSESYAVELAKGRTIKELEEIWSKISVGKNNPLTQYDPFYSLETEGVDELGSQQFGGNEVYRLRIGPFFNIEIADEICKKVAKFNLNCSVVRKQ